MSTTGILLLVFGIGAVALIVVALAASRQQQSSNLTADLFEVGKGLGWI